MGLSRLLGARDSEEWCNVRGLGLDWFTRKAVPYQVWEEGDAYLVFDRKMLKCHCEECNLPAIGFAFRRGGRATWQSH